MALEIQITKTFLEKILLSLVIGALIGLEREYTKNQEVVGIRTFSLVSLLGAVSVIVSKNIFNNFYVVLIGLIAVCGFSLFLYFSSIERGFSVGFTTNVAIIFAYIVGLIAGYGLFMEAVFVGVIIAIILYSRERMHELVEHMTKKEVNDLLEFAVVLGIVYPLIPTEPIHVLGVALPLHTVWLLIVTISLINFFSFIGSRYLKTEYEMPIVSFLGGLISTTGISASLATQFKNNKRLKNTIASGFLFAASAILIKNLLIASVFNTAAIKYLIPPMVICVAFLISIVLLKTKKDREKSKLNIKSPFHIRKAVEFGVATLVLITIIELVKGISPELVIVTALIGGIVSSTAITLSLVSLSLGGAIALPTFLFGIVMATIGSLLGNYIYLSIGKAKEIIKLTWKSILSTAFLLLATFITLFIYL